MSIDLKRSFLRSLTGLVVNPVGSLDAIIILKASSGNRFHRRRPDHTAVNTDINRYETIVQLEASSAFLLVCL